MSLAEYGAPNERTDQVHVGAMRNRRASTGLEPRDADRQRRRHPVERFDHERFEVHDILEAIADKSLEGARMARLVGPPEQDRGESVDPLYRTVAVDSELRLDPLQPSAKPESVERVPQVDVAGAGEVDARERRSQEREVEAGTVVRDEKIGGVDRLFELLEIDSLHVGTDRMPVVGPYARDGVLAAAQARPPGQNGACSGARKVVPRGDIGQPYRTLDRFRSSFFLCADRSHRLLQWRR